jgi:hypothetical protein
MKTKALFASVVLISTGASVASAQNIQGSDTLENVARKVIDACGENPALTYVGGGSGTGEGAMLANPGTQDFAPMSRLLNSPAADSCRINIADDAIGIWRSPSAACSDVPNARATLRQIYFGCTNDTSACAQDCGSATRRNLVASWNTIFGCSGGECTTGLRHAYRRDDTSGTTDVFRAQLGISTSLSPAAPTPGGVPVVPFCNGNDVGVLPQNPNGYAAGRIQQDLDPVRTACISSEDVCGPIPFNNVAALGFPAKTLGVVLTIEVPTAFYASGATVAASATDLFNPVACTSGAFALAPNGYLVAPPNTTATCPDGSKPVGGSSNLCYAPILRTGSTVSFNCTANPARPASSPTTFDGRANNVILRDAAGNVRNQPPAGSLTAARRVNTAFYRLHGLGGASGAGRGCNTYLNATETIGCMVAADPCSIGYAGFDANIAGQNQNQTVNGVNALASATAPNPSYLFYRKLWVNAIHCPAVNYPYNGGALQITQNGTGAVRQNMVDAFECFRQQGTSAAVSEGFFAPVGADAAPVVQHY